MRRRVQGLVVAAGVVVLVLAGCLPGPETASASAAGHAPAERPAAAPAQPAAEQTIDAQIVAAAAPQATPTPTPDPEPAPEPTPTTPPAPVPVDCAVVACVGLTFDDRPVTDTTRLLEILARNGVHATFFVMGWRTEATPDLTLAIAAGGHELGVHSWDHWELTRLSAGEVASQLQRTRDLLEQLTGVRPTLMRPPYGSTDAQVAAETQAAGLAQVLWSVDTVDWKVLDAGVVTDRAVNWSVRGSIILMHDIHPTTVDAVEGVIAGLRARGLEPVTVSELLGTGLQPGAIYRAQEGVPTA